MSLRSFCRLGASLAVLDFAHFGSSLSLRGAVKFGSAIQSFQKIEFINSGNYIADAGANTVEWYAGGHKAMSLTYTNQAGGSLHGQWTSTSTVQVSDKRLKKNIEPLIETLRATHPDFDAARAAARSKNISQPEESTQRTDSVAGWVLRQLRPVSYYFKKNDAKQMRFGFIADEMAKVLPQVVYKVENEKLPEDTPEEERKKPVQGIAYSDLISVLTAGIQELSSQIGDMRSRMTRAETELDRLDTEDPMDDDDEFV
jgi:hypothetical protein